MTKHEEKAKDLFLNGANCAQAVAAAFDDVVDIDAETLRKMASSFGGGMGRLREVCGAVSGMQLIAGMVFGYSKMGDNQIKAEHYSRVQKLAKEFSAVHGSIVCKDILKKDGPESPIPTVRTDDFYKTRPCLSCVMDAARILDEYIDSHKK